MIKKIITTLVLQMEVGKTQSQIGSSLNGNYLNKNPHDQEDHYHIGTPDGGWKIKTIKNKTIQYNTISVFLKGSYHKRTLICSPLLQKNCKVWVAFSNSST